MTPSLPRSVLITGANGGLGRATVEALLRDGVKHLVLACRTQERADELAASFGPTSARLTPLGGFDMNDADALEAAVDALPADLRLDVVFLQAGGVIFDASVQTVDWSGTTIERTVSQNVLGGHAVLAAILRRGLVSAHPRVVVAGGEGARGIPGMIRSPGFASPQALSQYLRGEADEPYNPMNAIGVSKLLSALLVRKLATRGDLDAVWFSPGLTGGTQGLRGAGGVKNWFGQNVIFKLAILFGKAQGAEAGGRRYADCILGRIGANGDILGAPEGTALGELVDQTPMNPALTDDALADAFWAVAEQAAGPFPGRSAAA